MNDLTERERLIVLAALSYVYMNVDDVNEALGTEVEGRIRVEEIGTTNLTGFEISQLMEKARLPE